MLVVHTRTRRVWTCALAWAALLLAAACGRSEPEVGTMELEEEPSAPGAETRGTARPAPTREQAEAAAAEIMAQWRARHPEREWASEPDPAHAIEEGADNLGVLEPPDETTQGEGHAYGGHTEREVLVWRREVERLVSEGDRVFHDADALGSPIGVSCDMCHPHAANTHPETYPKFQVQMGRTALLRDMINWCLERPLEASRMSSDDPRMRAMEAYIYAQRRGTLLNYGSR